MENNNEVFLRVTNHTGQAEKNLLGPAGLWFMVNKHGCFSKLPNDKMPTCMSNLLSSASRHVRKYFFIMRMSSRSFCES